ncbi:MAG: ATP-binding protein [Planctomycetaceae bacterium]
MPTKPSAKPRVLVIDDSPAIHEDFRKILVSEAGNSSLNDAATAFFGQEESNSAEDALEITLDSAHQGKDGYELVKQSIASQSPYSMAFVDMRMPPGWDGLTTIEKLWEVDADLQIVICSAYSDNTWSDITRRLGRSDRLLILKKPFDNAEVLQLAIAMIEKRRLATAARLRQEGLEELVGDRTQHLHEAQAGSERLIGAINQVLIEVDPSLIVQRWNDQAADTFGVAAADATGTCLTDLPIRWENSGGVAAFFADATETVSERFEATFTDSNTKNVVLSLSSYPIQADGTAVGALILGSNMTEHYLMEQQLNQAQKLESVGQLAAGVAHEINTPMQYLGDNLDFMKLKFERLVAYLQQTTELIDAAESAELQPELIADLRQKIKKLKLAKLYSQLPSALEDSIAGVAHVSRIVQAMKELSHPGSDKMASVDINHILKTTLTVSTNEWKYVADVQSNLDTEAEAVMGYAGELTQVFLNLIINSSHAISDKTAEGSNGKGLITVSTRQTEDSVVVEIADTGGGIPESIRDRIFDPFFTTKDVGKGTGQGLAIAHSVITQKHNGQLSFHVDEGVGTRFVIELPRQTAKCDQPITAESVVDQAVQEVLA